MLGMQNVLQINHPESKGKELERGTEVRPSPTGRESSVLRETLCGVCFDHIMLGSEVWGFQKVASHCNQATIGHAIIF